MSDNKYSAADISLEGYSNVADSMGNIAEGDSLLVVLAKLQNQISSFQSATFAKVPFQSGKLVYNGQQQEPNWSKYNENQIRNLSGSTF